MPDWQALFSEQQRSSTRTVIRHDGGLPSATKPQKFRCDDGYLYAVKFAQNRHGDGRGIFNEQVVARMGVLIGAPVATVELIEVPDSHADFLRQNQAAHGIDFLPAEGVHHGSRWVDGYSDRMALDHMTESTNRERFAALEVLYTWVVCAGDFQLIYRDTSPHTVLSVDHTTFFPGGENWTPASLNAAAGAVALDQNFGPVGITDAERQTVLTALRGVSAEDIAHVVIQPPDDWGISAAEREAVASFLYDRKAPVETLFAP